MSDDVKIAILCAWAGLAWGLVLRALDRLRCRQWNREMDIEWEAHLSAFHRPAPDGMCLGCGKRHFMPVAMDFARRVAEIYRGQP